MRPRAVDWVLFALIAFEMITGVGSLLVGREAGRWLFHVHRGVGLALLVVLYWKFRRVAHRLARPALWSLGTLVSIGATLTLAATIGTGVIWAIAQWPAGWPSGMNWHVLFALSLIPLYLWHMGLRWHSPRLRDLRDRRTVLRFLGGLVAGGAAWQLQEGLSRLAGAPGAGRRFTGSREVGSFQGNGFPITNWMLDNPAPIDLASWRLRVRGAVARELTFSYADLLARKDQMRALLDCTGGWYTVQDWQGVQVGWLLDQASPLPEAVAVSFRSVTGYRWSLPLAEARQALLATHVGGVPLSHGHGAPLRLVAPGRRGFQWVKWVQELVVLTEPDPGQWAAIFLSGLRAS